MGNRDQPACPHCGYDLSGVAAAWTGFCPLEGVCSECGGAFAWPDVLSPRLRAPEWLFEDRRGLAPVAAWRTWLRALHPAGFWRAVHPEHRVHPWRLVLWLIEVLVGAYVGRAALYTLVAWWTFQKHPGMKGNWDDLTWYGYALTWPVFSFRVAWGWNNPLWLVPHWPLYFWSTLAMSAAFALGATLVAAGAGRRDGRPIGVGHVWRAWVYSHAWLGLLGAIVAADLVISLVLMAVGAPTGGSQTTGFYYHRVFLAYGLLRAWPAATIVALAAWQAWWWNRAIASWDIPRARAVWLGLSVFSLGAGAAAAWTAHVLRPPDFQW